MRLHITSQLEGQFGVSAKIVEERGGKAIPALACCIGTEARRTVAVCGKAADIEVAQPGTTTMAA